MSELGKNILYKIDGNKLILEINLNPKEKTPSKSGKSLIYASTHGNKRVLADKEIFLGLNLYERVRKDEKE